jgi:uncharacterized membrane protein
VNPIAHSRTWGMTIFFGLFLNVVYGSLRLMSQRGMQREENIEQRKMEHK